ncbi:Carbon-nitrogen hydrolase [Penicillium argentinense]|uniref:Carbon-nitrogen hydrolase n=1 Tax=Penicillium argentinense TaxID=1131581 RepID=A0A9W9FG96_9EURO|nr:Carbon-nitrogen hydrolase [Penicillium argentinense]KAJ5099535.1 Carbon-nitrogen hydrolase [Penicillium argentinense]
MRIATLQIAPKLGDVDGNIRRANELLKNGKAVSIGGQDLGIGIGAEQLRPELLVLPEMALTGYNFPSLEAVKPFLEPVGKGPSAAWARETAQRLQCKVCVGYPEIENDELSQDIRFYNSLVVVDENGDVIHNYRKSYLYFTDETWAAEGDVERGFRELCFPSQGKFEKGQGSVSTADHADASDTPRHASEKRVAATFGICMDINPYKFEAPYTAYEFANRVLDSKTQLVVLSMAWLTHMSREELDGLHGEPDLDTLNYWIQRFWPLIEKKMQHAENVDGPDLEGDGTAKHEHKKGKQVVIVFANRSGEEPAADDEKPPARYAGTSTVIAVTQRPRGGSDGSGVGGAVEIDEGRDFDVKILCWDLLGAGEEGICFADTTADPKMVFGLRSKSRGE